MDVRTRWNSTFSMLQRIIRVKDEFNTTLIKFNRATKVLTQADVKLIEEIIEFLEMFDDLCKRISHEK